MVFEVQKFVVKTRFRINLNLKINISLSKKRDISNQNPPSDR